MFQKPYQVGTPMRLPSSTLLFFMLFAVCCCLLLVVVVVAVVVVAVVVVAVDVVDVADISCRITSIHLTYPLLAKAKKTQQQSCRPVLLSLI